MARKRGGGAGSWSRFPLQLRRHKIVKSKSQGQKSKLRHKIPKTTKQLIIQALVFPHIQYCLTVWGSCNATQKHRIQKIINFAARIVTGFKRSQHITPALQALGWPRVDALIEGRDVQWIPPPRGGRQGPETRRASSSTTLAPGARGTKTPGTSPNGIRLLPEWWGAAAPSPAARRPAAAAATRGLATPGLLLNTHRRPSTSTVSPRVGRAVWHRRSPARLDK